ncbi:MAG: DNA-binding protein [Cyanobacteria bacterium PR.023]|nr:DNA-binding protein [Cyanobacteria bacterium PR.3.49]MBA4073630.1 DNA-binding protein [Cyanobacteria bacterium PR.023]
MGRTAVTLPIEQRESLKPALGTSAEVAEFLNCEEVTVRTWRRTGKGPRFIRVGRLVRYRWSDVEAWLAEREAASTSTPKVVNQ